MDHLYEQHRGYVEALSWKFARQYNLDQEEVLSEANFQFVRAIQIYQPDRCPPRRFLWRKIWRGLQNWRDKYVKHPLHRMKHPTGPFPESWDWDEAQSLTELQDELSNEARTVIQLVLNAPEEILEHAIYHGSRPRNLARGIKQHLREQRWTWKQIRNVWKEIRKALQ